jgi:hypothetical protein
VPRKLLEAARLWWGEEGEEGQAGEPHGHQERPLHDTSVVVEADTVAVGVAGGCIGRERWVVVLAWWEEEQWEQDMTRHLHKSEKCPRYFSKQASKQAYATSTTPILIIILQ